MAKINKTVRKDAATQFSTRAKITTILSNVQKHLKSYKLGAELSNWKVGITNDPDRRFKEMIKDFGVSRLIGWHCWNAQTKDNSLIIEKSFCDKGMKRCNSQVFHSEDSKYVYVYQLPAKERNNPKYF